MLIGSATRYLASRGAVQTVYWRSSLPECEAQGGKMLKYGRFLSIAEKKGVKEPSTSAAVGQVADYGVSTKRALLKAYNQQMYARTMHTLQ